MQFRKYTFRVNSIFSEHESLWALGPIVPRLKWQAALTDTEVERAITALAIQHNGGFPFTINLCQRLLLLHPNPRTIHAGTHKYAHTCHL